MSWQPLCDDDPVPGDPVAVADYARSLTATADLISGQVSLLAKLANPDNWVADTADAFRDQANDLRGKIDKAEGRYREVGSELSGWSGEMEAAQTKARGLLVEAQQQQAVADANPMPAAGQPLPPGATPEQQQAHRCTSDAADAQRGRHQAAADAVDGLRDQLDDLVDQTKEQAWQRGRRIRAALGDDLGNSFWDKVKAFISQYAEALRTIATWAGRVAMVLGAIALVIALLSNPAGWVILIGSLATLGAALATTVSLVSNSGLALSHNGSWTSVAFDAVSLATFGVGRWASTGAREALALSTRNGARVAGGAASDASLAEDSLRLAAGKFFSGRHMPSVLRNPAAAYVAGRGQLAAIAENAARAGVTTGPAVTAAQRVLMGEMAAVRSHAQQLLSHLPSQAGVTDLAQQATRLAAVSISAVAAGDVSALTKDALDHDADSALDVLKILVTRLGGVS